MTYERKERKERTTTTQRLKFENVLRYVTVSFLCFTTNSVLALFLVLCEVSICVCTRR